MSAFMTDGSLLTAELLKLGRLVSIFDLEFDGAVCADRFRANRGAQMGCPFP